MNQSGASPLPGGWFSTSTEQEQRVHNAKDQGRDQLGQAAQVAPQREKILLEDGKYRLGKQAEQVQCWLWLDRFCGRPAALFAGDNLHPGPAGVIQTLGSDDGKPERKSCQPERGSHQQTTWTASDLLPVPPVPVRPNSTAASVCWQAP